MSKSDENEILRRLERISRIEPKGEDTARAMERVRQTLTGGQESGGGGRQGFRRVFAAPLSRFAAAAVLLIVAGFLAGRSFAPGPDIDQIELALEGRLTASVEAAIREDLLEELNQSWQSALVDYHARLNDEFNRFAVELGEQRRNELNELAAKTFAASNAVTQQLLSDLVQAVATAQNQDRQWFTAAMRRIESNRIQDATRFNTGLVTLAEQTRVELADTKRSVAQLTNAIVPDQTFREMREN